MALIFPSASVGQTYSSGSSATYQWNGSYWNIVQPASIQVLNALTASYIATASYASYASQAGGAQIAASANAANYAADAGFATSAANATSASYATSASLAQRALNATSASYATAASSLLVSQIALPNVRSSYTFGRAFVYDYNRILRAGDGTGNQPAGANTSTNNMLATYDVPIKNRPDSITKFYESVGAYVALGTLNGYGYVYTYGDNTNGILGSGDTTNKLVMTAITSSGMSGSLITVADIWSTSEQGANNSSISTFAKVYDNGTLKYYAWGANSYGQLGLGNTTSPILTPTLVSSLTGIDVSLMHLGDGVNGSTFAIATSGSAQVVYSTGNNTQGQLGVGDITNRSSFVKVGPSGSAAFTDVADVWTSYGTNGSTINLHMTAIRRSNGEVWMAGTNYQYRTGNGTNAGNATYFNSVKTSSSSSLSNITDIIVRSCNSVALDNSGNVWSWGPNDGGFWGDGTAADTQAQYAKIIQTGVIAMYLNGPSQFVPNLFVNKGSKTYGSGYNSNWETGTANESDNSVITSAEVIFQKSGESVVATKSIGLYTTQNYKANIFLTSRNRIYITGLADYSAGAFGGGNTLGTGYNISIPAQITDYN